MSEEANFSVTVKTPRGNLVTVRGDTASEWKANLEAAGTSGALAMITQVEASLAAAANPTQGASGGHQASQAQPSAATATAAGQSSPTQTRQPSQELPPGFANPACGVCGAATRFDKAGNSQQSGKPYKRFLCTKDHTHKATFTD